MSKLQNHLIVLSIQAFIVTNILAIACSSVPTAELTPSAKPAPPPLTTEATTKVQFLGQSCFLITSGTGLKIIMDPYTTNERTYSAINETADIVTVSHEHSDHNNVAGVNGNPEVIKGTGIAAVPKV